VSDFQRLNSGRPSCAVVIPAYNVANQIVRVLAGLPEWIDEIIVVNDESSDKTAEVLAELHHPKLRVIARPTNGGVGAATKTGYREALRGGADIVVKMDGDDQMDPAQLPALVMPIVLGKADYTKGNRFRDRLSLRAMPPLRRLGNLALSFLTKLASGYWNIFDPTNGYTAVRADVLRGLRFENIADRYFFEISMLVELNLANACVKDVPMPSRYADENSSLKIGRILTSFPAKLVAATGSRIRDKYFLYDFSAVSLFLVASAPLMTIGTVLGVKYWHHSIVSGVPTTAGQVMLAVLPLLIGFQLLLQAFVIDIGSVPQVSQYGPVGGIPEGRSQGVGGAGPSPVGEPPPGGRVESTI
jgi:glycosyltransferase involved in cell wall biosynthesis